MRLAQAIIACVIIILGGCGQEKSSDGQGDPEAKAQEVLRDAIEKAYGFDLNTEVKAYNNAIKTGLEWEEVAQLNQLFECENFISYFGNSAYPDKKWNTKCSVDDKYEVVLQLNITRSGDDIIKADGLLFMVLEITKLQTLADGRKSISYGRQRKGGRQMFEEFISLQGNAHDFLSE